MTWDCSSRQKTWALLSPQTRDETRLKGTKRHPRTASLLVRACANIANNLAAEERATDIALH